MKNYIQLIFFTIILIFLNKEKIQIPFNIRKLFKSEIKSYVCNKADSNLMNKYRNGFDEEVINKKEELNKEQRALVNFFKHSSYENIKPYIKRIGVFIAFLVLDIIFIFFWILLCIFCYKKNFIFQKSKLTKKKFIIFSSIVLIFNLLIIIFSIVILILNNSFFEKINGIGCSFMLFFDHINYGLSPSYPIEAQHWLGFVGIIEKFQTDEDKLHNINYGKINAAYNNAETIYNNHQDCISSFDGIESDKTSFVTFSNEIYGDLNLNSLIKLIEKGKNVIEKTMSKIEDKLYVNLHDTANNYIKNSFISFFVLILSFSLSSLLILYLYFSKKYNYYKILYIINWNILTILMIFVIVISTTSGVIGVLLKDGIHIYNYVFSLENLVNDKPLILITKDKLVGNLIDMCSNDKTTFVDVLEISVLSFTKLEKEHYENQLNEIKEKSCDEDVKNALVEFYQAIIDEIDIIDNIIKDLLDIKCSFVKNDVNIILHEVDSGGKKGIVLSVFQFLVGIFLAISIFTGVILVHKYNFEIENCENKNISTNTDVKIKNKDLETNKIYTFKKDDILESNNDFQN